MKNILIISPSIDVKGGISTVIKGHLDSSISEKHRIFRVSSHRDGNRFLKLLTALFGMINTVFIMLFKKIDIVHIHGSDVVSSLRKYFFLKLVEKFNCKIVYHFHGASFMEQYPSKQKIWKDKIKYLFEKSNLVICLSKKWENQILRIMPSAKTMVVKNAVQLPAIYKKTHIEKKDHINLLFFGLIGERKGVFDLLKVIKKLKKNGNKIKLFIGGNGEINRLRSAINALKLENSVFYVGWVTDDEKASFFEKSDIYILPSYGEGMPMSILEAMSYGLPVISTNVGGIPDLVVDNETGFLIQPGDIDGMFEQIGKLIKDRKLISRMGLNARKMIEKDYNLDQNILKLEKIYQKLLNSG